MKKPFLKFCTLLALSTLALPMTLQSSSAQQLAIVELDPQTNGGIPAPSPIKIKLSETKPTAITNEPKYRTKPRYGVITMGTAKENQIIVALDFGPDVAEPRLFVDSNGNGDLTDDKRVEMTLQKELSKEGRSGKVFSAYGNVISRYDRNGEVRSIMSTLSFFVKNDELSFNRAYARMGSVAIGDSKYKVALLDQRMDGNFSSYKHGESEEPILSLLIDKNRDGFSISPMRVSIAQNLSELEARFLRSTPSIMMELASSSSPAKKRLKAALLKL